MHKNSLAAIFAAVILTGCGTSLSQPIDIPVAPVGNIATDASLPTTVPVEEAVITEELLPAEPAEAMTDFENNPIDEFFLEKKYVADTGVTSAMVWYANMQADAWKAEMINCYDTLYSLAINDYVRKTVEDEKLVVIAYIESNGNFETLFLDPYMFSGVESDDGLLGTIAKVLQPANRTHRYKEKTKDLFKKLEEVGYTPQFIFSAEEYEQVFSENYPMDR